MVNPNNVGGAAFLPHINRNNLIPRFFKMRAGSDIRFFVDTHIEIIKIDFIFNAGTASQEKKLQASAAIRLLTEGTKHHSASEIAEFMDFRGIVVEKNLDEVCSTLTLYTLRRYLNELLPLLREIITEPTYPDKEFRLHIDNRRQNLMTQLLRPSFVARNAFYQQLYGANHPMGRHANVDDFDLLTVEDVRVFQRHHINPQNATIVIGGNIDDEVLKLFDAHFGDIVCGNGIDITIPEPQPEPLPTTRFNGVPYLCKPVPGAVQNTLRVGRLLPMQWDSMDYARTVVLSTLLGGYFGSRLMSNIREDKGYTYGIYAQTRICRESLLFSISTDVSPENADNALSEILLELRRLCDEPVPDEELDLVRKCIIGDFMRSVDGIFERSERYCQQLSAGIKESFTDNLFEAVKSTTPTELQSLAQRLFNPKELLIVKS